MASITRIFLFRSPPGSRSDPVRGGERGIAQCIGLPYGAPIVRACEFGVYKKQSPQRLSFFEQNAASVALASLLHCTSLHSGGWQIATCYQSLDMSGQDISSPSQSLSPRPGASRRRRSSRTPLPITSCCHHRIHHCPIAFASVIVVSFISMLVHHSLRTNIPLSMYKISNQHHAVDGECSAASMRYTSLCLSALQWRPVMPSQHHHLQRQQLLPPQQQA